MPCFSVIVPVYKAEKFLHTCVESVLGQSFPDYELILVDDGSPDNCPALCDEYAAGDDRVRVIHKENGGVSSARNAGMRAAAGEYLVFLDSDDWWCEPNGLEILHQSLCRRPVDVLIYGVRTIDARTGRPYPQPWYPPELNEMDTEEAWMLLLKRGTLLCSFCEGAFRRSFVEEHALYADEDLITAEDGEWVMRTMCARPRYGFLNDTIYCTPRGTADVFRGTRWDRLNAMLDFLEAYLRRGYESERLRRAVLGLGAYHYTLLCAQAAAGERCPERKKLLRRARASRNYWNYAVEQKAAKAAQVSRILGYGLTVRLLGAYMKRR